MGPNGAGKTTVFYMITGLVPADSGRITIDAQDVTSLPMYRRARLGIGYLPQEASIFRGLSVEKNIMAVLELVESDPAAAPLPRPGDENLGPLALRGVGGMLRAEEVPLLRAALETERERLLAGGIDALSWQKLREALLDAETRGLPFLEATEIYSGPEGILN